MTPKKKLVKEEKGFKGREVRLLSKAPALAVDGTGIFIQNTDNIELVFVQVINSTNEFIEANGVTVVRMDMNKLKVLRDSINSLIQDYEKNVKE